MFLSYALGQFDKKSICKIIIPSKNKIKISKIYNSKFSVRIFKQGKNYKLLVKLSIPISVRFLFLRKIIN